MLLTDFPDFLCLQHTTRLVWIQIICLLVLSGFGFPESSCLVGIAVLNRWLLESDSIDLVI
jgi:hypothetical protein